MSDTQYDTPETVAQKMSGLAAMLGPFMHYLGNRHDGDWEDCTVEGCYSGELEVTDDE